MTAPNPPVGDGSNPSAGQIVGGAVAGAILNPLGVDGGVDSPITSGNGGVLDGLLTPLINWFQNSFNVVANNIFYGAMCAVAVGMMGVGGFMIFKNTEGGKQVVSMGKKAIMTAGKAALL